MQLDYSLNPNRTRRAQARSWLTCSSAANDAWAETRIAPAAQRKYSLLVDFGRLRVGVAECYPLFRCAIPERPQKKNQGSGVRDGIMRQLIERNQPPTFLCQDASHVHSGASILQPAEISRWSCCVCRQHPFGRSASARAGDAGVRKAVSHRHPSPPLVTRIHCRNRRPENRPSAIDEMDRRTID